MSDNQPSYSEVKKAQAFFGKAIELCMNGDLTSLKETVTKFTSENPQYKLIDIFQNFQSEGRTFLHVAATSGHENIFDFVFKNCKGSIHINSKDVQGFTPLMNATISESYSIMSKLLSNGSNVNDQNKDGAAAIHFAAADGSITRLKLLLEHKADITLVSQAGNPLHWAAGKGRTEAMKLLIEYGIDIDALSPTGLPAVFLAAVSKSDDGVKLLVEAGANVGFIVTGNLTLLHICSENGLRGAVEAILKNPTGLKCCTIKTNEGNGPIHLAAMDNNRDIVELLLPYSREILDTTDIDAILEQGKERMKLWLDTHNNQDVKPEMKNISNSETSVAIESSLDLFDSLVSPLSEDAVKRSEELKILGNQAFKEKRYEEAIEYYNKGIQENNKSVALWSNRSACYLACNRYQEALRDAEICRRLDPSWPKGCYRLASARLASQEFEEAALAAFEGCKLEPGNNELKELMQKAVKLGREHHEKKIKVEESEKSNLNKSIGTTTVI